MLKGYLTYIMALVAILVGVSGLIWDWFDTMTALTIIWAGFTTGGVRRAIGS